jgi:hypothetical protein
MSFPKMGDENNEGKRGYAKIVSVLWYVWSGACSKKFMVHAAGKSGP